MSSSTSALTPVVGNSTANTTSVTGTKWQPGHYIKVGRNEYTQLLQEDGGRFGKFLNNSQIQGFEVIFYWRQLEKAKGQYDFSEVEKVLNVLRKHDKHLILSVHDRSFWEGANENPVPDYLYQMGGTSRLAGVAHRPDRPGVAATTWKSDVMDRYIAVFQAIGKRFDNDPNFLGAQTTETALTTQIKPDKAALREQYERLALEGKKAMPHSMFIVGLNFLNDGRGENAALMDIAKAVEQAGGSALTTPDVAPSKGVDFSAYPVLHAFKDRVAIIAGGDDHRRASSDTPERVQLFAKNHLGADYIVWKTLPDELMNLEGAPPPSFGPVYTTKPGSGGNGGTPTPPPPKPDDDFVINPPTDNNNPLSSKLVITPSDTSRDWTQNKPPLLDLRTLDLNQDNKLDSRVAITFNTIRSDSNLNNSVGFYRIADESGAVFVPGSDKLINPGDAGYAKAALGQRVSTTQLTENTGRRTVQLDSGVLLAPYLISNGTAEQFLSKNPTNVKGKGGMNAYFGYIGANPDSTKHIRFGESNNQFNFEETWNSSNKDFNDFSFRVQATTA